MSEPDPRLDSGVAIRAEPALTDPQTCRFVISQVVHPGGPFFYKSAEAGKGSPLIERLFGIEGVASVLVAENVVSITKTASTPWPSLLKPIGAAIRTLLLSGIPALYEQPLDPVERARTDAELAVRIQELLDRDINPSVAAHGGKISVEQVKNAVLYLQMTGGCQGCSSSAVTLRQGVEVMVRKAVPEITDIVDTTDHSSGKTPFYSPVL